nr:glycosyl hydrolase [Pedobacter panaciterrae]
MKQNFTKKVAPFIMLLGLLVVIITRPIYGQSRKGSVQASTNKKISDKLINNFVKPPDHAKAKVYWFWIYNRVTKEGITRDLEEFRAKGISGVNLICNGGYAGKAPLPGVEFLGEEWRALFRHAIREAKRLNIEFGFNMAGGWTMMGPRVTQDDAMKKLVFSELVIDGGEKFSGTIALPEKVDGYYQDINVQAFPIVGNGKEVDATKVVDVTGKLYANGQFEWDVPQGKWLILRSGYTLTGGPWARWKVYPEGDTFKGAEGYQIDYLSKSALDNYFNDLGKTVMAEAKKAGGKINYLWCDSWECGKLTWTQDFSNQFKKFRGYDLMPFLPALAGYTVTNSDISTRFREDFDRTIQDCLAENFYGHFADLCHKNGMRVGNEAGGPNDIPPQDVLKNFKKNDILAGEFWVNGHRNAKGGYNKNRWSRLNLKQTATAAHVYGKRQVDAEAFTEQERDATHWTLGPSDLKPYANDAFAEGINRFMLHSATCQPPSDGKPGYEYCAGTHFTPNVTWWDQSAPFFDYLNRCQYMLQQGNFVADVCFYLGERPPLLAPPKYNIPTLGPGYDCDYFNPDVLLTRMSVKNGRIVLPDGMNYKVLVLQNCVSPVPEIAEAVGRYQGLTVSSTPSKAMSLPVIKKLRDLIYMGATVIGAPPENAGELINYAQTDPEVRKIAKELWGDLDGQTKTERTLGKGRLIWGKTPREVLTGDGVTQDFSFTGQTETSDDFDYIHRATDDTEIYFVINRTNERQTREFTFRVTGKVPEIWDALTGKAVDAKSYNQIKNSTTLPLEFDSFGSYFIVFRKPIDKNKNGLAKSNFAEFNGSQNITGSWNVSFDPKWGGPAKIEFPSLTSWTQHSEEGVKYYSGTAVYSKKFDLDQAISNETGRVYLDLGNVKNVAEISLNGKKLGILWCAPWRVEITDVMKKTGNLLEIKVINLWSNRVVHDLSLPVSERLTKTHEEFRFDMLNKDTPMLESGLLGPVKLDFAK